MENIKVKTIFFGTGDFAVKILNGILDLTFLEVIAVITQPDKIAGREKELRPTKIKEYIKNNNIKIKVYDPIKLKDESESIITETDPELIIVADYGQMIPSLILDYPKYKCLNVHGSLLPDLRGAVPATIAILKGYTKTGVSIPIMTKGLDDGDIIASKEIDILPSDTTYTLRMRLADNAVVLLQEILPLWIKGDIKAIKQDNEKATYTYERDIAKDNARINIDTPVEIAERMIRAYTPWPVAWVEVMINGNKKRVKIFEAELAKNTKLEAGGFRRHEKKLYLVLKDGALMIKKIQLEGKPIMEYINAMFLVKINIVN